jgi:large subunit ribosomal protein L28
MARECEICGKRPQVGNRVETRGKAKYLGGVGTKVTGITRRLFSPNLQRVKVTLANGSNKRIRVCTQCIRSGSVVKAIRTAPFKLPDDAVAKAATKAAATATAVKPPKTPKTTKAAKK